jgi:ABC-type uncharacterized transport system substrate-binding protein
MRRREFITLIGTAAATWPLAARAQQRTMPVLGYLDPTSPADFAESRRAFLQGLKEAGYVEGKNLAISYRFAENQLDRLPELADDLVRHQVTVIFTFASGVSAAKAATTTIPIVFPNGSGPCSSRLCRQPCPTGRQSHRPNVVERGPRCEAVGAAARARAQGDHNWLTRQSEKSECRRAHCKGLPALSG